MSFWDTCFASTDRCTHHKWLQKMVTRIHTARETWSPFEHQHPRQMFRNSGHSSRNILKPVFKKPRSNFTRRSENGCRKCFLPKSFFMDTISSLAHCQPHAGTPIPGIPSQVVRTLAKGQGGGRLKKKNHGLTPKMGSLVQKLSRMDTFN